MIKMKVRLWLVDGRHVKHLSRHSHRLELGSYPRPDILNRLYHNGLIVNINSFQNEIELLGKAFLLATLRILKKTLSQSSKKQNG